MDDEATGIDPSSVVWDSGRAEPERKQPPFSRFAINDADQEKLDEEKMFKAANRESAFKAVKNFPDSLYKLAENIYQAVRHPIDTGKAVGKAAVGAVQLAVPGEQEYEQNARAVADFFVERYGGEDKLRKTIEEDPAGFLADLSTVFTGASGVAKGAAAIAGKTPLSAIAPTLSGAGKALSATGAAVDPISLAVTAPLKVASKAIPEGGRFSPESFYESAVKPSTTLSKEERMARATTGLEHGIMPTQGGLDKLRGLITEIDNQVDDIIKSGPYGGNPINTQAVTTYLNDLKDFAKQTVNPQENLAKIERVEKRFLDAHGTAMSVEAAHQLKKNTYTELKKFYDQFQRNAAMEAKKQLARGLKEEVYDLYPELREMGKKEGALIALEESIERAANRISNRDIIGIGVPIKGGFGGLIGDKAGAVAGVAAGILDTPLVKAKLAAALYKMRKTVDPLRGNKTRMGAYQFGNIGEIENE